MFVKPGSIVERGDVLATISDPNSPGLLVDIVAPEDGLMICTATNPFVTAGTPVAHFLPVSKHIELIKTQIATDGTLIVSGSLGEPIWREDDEVEEVEVGGEWSVGGVDAEWNIETAADNDDDEDVGETSPQKSAV